jgi:hypothetical protein
MGAFLVGSVIVGGAWFLGDCRPGINQTACHQAQLHRNIDANGLYY